MSAKRRLPRQRPQRDLHRRGLAGDARGCLVGNNGTAQVRTEGQSHTRIVDCDLLDNTAPPLVREGGEVEIEKPPPAPRQASPETTPLPHRKKSTASLPVPRPPRTAY